MIFKILSISIQLNGITGKTIFAVTIAAEHLVVVSNSFVEVEKCPLFFFNIQLWCL